MSLTSLPTAPNLEYYRKQAKALLHSCKTGDLSTQDRVRRILPRLDAAAFALNDAQWVLAREHGFPSWPRFKQHIESILEQDIRHRPFVREVGYYEERAKGLLSVLATRQSRAFNLLRQFHPQFCNASDAEILKANPSLKDAKLVYAREHGFDGWDAFANHIEALASGAEVEPFMQAFDALEAGKIDEFKLLIRQYPDLVRASGTNGNSLLNLAGSTKQIEAISILLENGANPDQANNKGWTSLHQAAYLGPHCEGDIGVALLKMLLAAGASTDLSAHGDGGTPLMVALFWGHTPQAELLAERGVEPLNLRVASGLGRLDLIRSLVNSDSSLKPQAGMHREFHRPHSGFPAWVPSDNQQEILDEALVYAAKSGRTEAADVLVKLGAHVNSEPYNGASLHWAASGGHVETARRLLELGADINLQTSYGGVKSLTPLHVAAWSGKTEMCRFLVEAGADTTIRDPEYHGRAWGWAAYFCKAEVRDYLLDTLSHANIHAAAAFGNVERIEGLLNNQPELVNHHDGWSTPLMEAVNYGRSAAVEFLIAKGADTNAANGEGKTALDIAKDNENQAMAELLQRIGALTSIEPKSKTDKKEKKMSAATSQQGVSIGSDAVKAATGKNWDEWFAIFDEAGCATMTHQEIVAIARQYGAGSWWQQMVTVEYERARGKREMFQSCDGEFRTNVGKTLNVPIQAVFDAWNDPEKRTKWLGKAELTIRKATSPKSLRITWSDGTNLDVNLFPKSDSKSTCGVECAKLAGPEAVQERKVFWTAAMERLKEYLEG